MRHGRPSIAKREREKSRKDNKQAKDDRRTQRRKDQADRPAGAGESEDPDIAGIVPGPQRPPEAFRD